MQGSATISRILWFIALWFAGLATITVVAMIIKLFL